MDVMDGVELRRRGVLPAEAERRHAALHLAEHEARLLAHAGRRDVAEPHDMIAVVAAALRRFAAAGDDERRLRVRRGSV